MLRAYSAGRFFCRIGRLTLDKMPAWVLHSRVESRTFRWHELRVIEVGACFDPSIGVKATEERAGGLEDDSLKLGNISFEVRIVGSIMTVEIIVSEEDERSIHLSGRAYHDQGVGRVQLFGVGLM